MNPRFQADADLNEIIVTALLRREPSVDFQTAMSAGLSGRSDLDVLALAADSMRLLVTHDRKTMPGHFATFVASRPSSGVLIVPQNMPISRAVEDLLLIWTATDADEWKNVIYALPI